MKRIVAIVLTLVMTALMFCQIAVSAETTDPQQVADELNSLLSEPRSEETATVPAEPTVRPTEPATEAPATTTKPTTTKPSTTAAPKIVYYGDLNRDYRVTAKEARWILQFSARLVKFTNLHCHLADIDHDGRITASDARKALRVSARLLPGEEFKEQVADPDTYVLRYGKADPYKPTLAGFTTNIDDETVYPLIKKLEDYCRALGSTATLYYTDVQQQYYISYNSNRVYRTQCTIKAPYSKAILAYMEKNNISIDKRLTLTSGAKWSGHYLSGFASGSTFTIGELIGYAIRLSDNTAYQVLFNYFGAKPFNDSNAAAGSNLRLGTYIFGENSASDMAKLYLDIYRYNGKYRDFLYTQMNNKNTSTKDMIGGGIPNGVTVLHKWGSGGSMTVGLHDCGIVYSSHPFVLIVYTSFNFDRWFDHLPFQRIAQHCYGINIKIRY